MNRDLSGTPSLPLLPIMRLPTRCAKISLADIGDALARGYGRLRHCRDPTSSSPQPDLSHLPKPDPGSLRCSASSPRLPAPAASTGNRGLRAGRAGSPLLDFTNSAGAGERRPRHVVDSTPSMRHRLALFHCAILTVGFFLLCRSLGIWIGVAANDLHAVRQLPDHQEPTSIGGHVQ